MGEDIVQRLSDKIDNVRDLVAGVSEAHARTDQSLRDLQVSIDRSIEALRCGKHEQTLTDHETRIVALESKAYAAAKIVAGISVIGGLVIGLGELVLRIVRNVKP